MGFGFVMVPLLHTSVLIKKVMANTRYISEANLVKHHTVYYCHADSPDFKRIISTAKGNELLAEYA